MLQASASYGATQTEPEQTWRLTAASSWLQKEIHPLGRGSTLLFPAVALADTINAWMVDALRTAALRLTFSREEVATHQLIRITGWDLPELRQPIARYLVGLRVNAITAALAVRCGLTDTPADTAEVWENVVAIVGETPASLNANQISTRRNPWIAEALWHLCMAAARQRAELHPPGQVLAVSLPHVKTIDPGLDLAILFRDGASHGLSIVETKAYEHDVAGALDSCVTFFGQIDRGQHNLRLRQMVSALRAEIGDQNQTSDGLWRDRRCYFPNVHFDDATPVDWTAAREEFAPLAPGPTNIFVVPHGIAGFANFFTRIADQMRIEAHALSHV